MKDNRFVEKNLYIDPCRVDWLLAVWQDTHLLLKMLGFGWFRCGNCSMVLPDCQQPGGDL